MLIMSSLVFGKYNIKIVLKHNWKLFGFLKKLSSQTIQLPLNAHNLFVRYFNLHNDFEESCSVSTPIALM